ncbi:YaiI/YqxD family protein [Selenomonas sputigena]|uniref:UPF0178 protein QCO44_00110 n=1 Tax=Selenomonas sputigena TaxID=69823 RepID=A0ABV3X340_9FIRM
MRILVDADACPVVEEIEEVAQKFLVPVILLCDTSHILHSEYAEVKIVGRGAEAVDVALINLCRAGDIVVTQDYGVAAMALGKRAYAMNQDGWQYTDRNIDRLLMKRYAHKKPHRILRKKHWKGPRKRVKSDDVQFQEKFETLVLQCLEMEAQEKGAGEPGNAAPI